MSIRRFYSEDLRTSGYKIAQIVQSAENYEITLDLANRQETLWIIPPQLLTEILIDPNTGTEVPTPIKSINVTISFENAIANFSQGKILVVQGDTKVNLTFPSNSTGKFEVGPDSTSLIFVYTNNGYIWTSSEDSSTYSLGANGTVDFFIDPVNGVDDRNPGTPYLTINHTIQEINRLVPYTYRPTQSSGYSGDRFIGVRVHLASGTYATTPNEVDGTGNPIASETVFAQYLSRYGIDFIGEGTTPNDVIIYGNNANDCIKLSGSHEVNFTNITFSSNRSGIYALDSRDITITNCIFINRSSSVKNAIFASRGSRVILQGEIELQGNFRRLINCNMQSIAEVNCNVTVIPATVNSQPFEGFLSAFKGSDIYAQNMTVPGGVPQGGIALVVDSPKCTIEMPTDIAGLTYP